MTSILTLTATAFSCFFKGRRALILENLALRKDEKGWKAAASLQVQATRPLPPDKGASVSVEVHSVHTDTDVYFLVTWADSTESVSHKTWAWNAGTNSYEQGDDREDMFALAFEHTGPFDADMLSGAARISEALSLGPRAPFFRSVRG